MKKPIIIANWKMNPESASDARKLAGDVAKGVKGVKAEVVLCPPHVFIQGVKRPGIQVGAQNCFWKNKGAYTGEISPSTLKKMGCSYVILGHSERKKYLDETIEQIQKKTKAAFVAKLKVVMCVGEKKKTEKSRDIMEELHALLKDMKTINARKLVIVYEPIWAISSESGSVALPTLVRDRAAAIRRILAWKFGKKADAIPILYGGSVDAKNIKPLMRDGNVQGALVGAASLNAKEFVRLVKNSVLR
ncbi:MAG: triose-phosphate isomerase [Patescibacteria group bacterium]|nr:triose-phosphate isomerase [Patescibacteria group bacterium]